MNQLRHIGIIMDGNGRWAEKMGRPRIYGHVKGARVAKKIITECAKENLKYLTLYAFSTENWLRPEQEVSFLMRLLERYLKKETRTLINQNIRFTAIGQLSRLPKEVVEVIQQTTSATKNCTGMNLIFALSYGSKSELVVAAQKIARDAVANKIDIETIDESTINQSLSTYPAPDADLIIRTSGEKRLSNFLLWQSAYAELFFSDTLWPDFNSKELGIIINGFFKRNRKYGQVTQTVSNQKINAELSN